MAFEQTRPRHASGMTFGTKAQTLLKLRPLVRHACVLPSYSFDVADWTEKQPQQLQSIRKKFGTRKLIIRSSAVAEDSLTESFAGAFHTELGVDGQSVPAITRAVENVIRSYPGENPDNQVLVQPMLEDIAISGVITTYTLNDGAPYYVINYDDESGKTDTVTGGTGVNKTVLIHRQATPEMIQSPRVAQWLHLAQELETLFPDTPLDIEFAQTRQNVLYLLQVRPMCVSKFWNRQIAEKIKEQQAYIVRFIQEHSATRGNLLGTKTCLGEMSDWNPAEMIGTSPRPLAASLYRYLITDRVWRKSRAAMGYRQPEGEALMVLVGGRPYIDIRNSFNSFLPATLPDSIGEKLVNAWMERLEAHPELHDKVEFDVAQTAIDFDFTETFYLRYPEVLTPGEFQQFQGHLTQLTRSCLDITADGTLAQALGEIHTLETRQQAEPLAVLLKGRGKDILYSVRRLLQECVQFGTFPFAVIARHAFIAEALLRSAVRKEALSEDRLRAFKASLKTITADMSRDFAGALASESSQAAFLEKYGHLRPGTYDILSARYDQRPDLFQSDDQTPDSNGQSHPVFHLSEAEHQALKRLLSASGLEEISPEHLLHYCKQAIVGREAAKFVFTRSLSAVLELLAAWGESVALSREEITFTTIQQLLDSLVNPILLDEESHYKALAESGCRELEVARSLRLSYLIRDVDDIYIIPLHRSAPNFVTQQVLEGETVLLNSRDSGTLELKGKIVCIENADPGFDWIFTRGIAGLITKFGGSNSHMAIRCAEFQIPAAIGCGEQTFELLIGCGKVEMHCGDKIVRPVYPEEGR